MECTRCGKKLIEGVNIYRGWHLPICTDCRMKILNKMREGSQKEWELTKKEKKIMKERYKDEDARELKEVFSHKKEKPKIEKYYTGKFNRFWEISEKILFYVSIIVAITGVSLFALQVTCSLPCQDLCDASFCLERCRNMFWATISCWIILLVSYSALQFAIMKKEETKWRKDDASIP